MKLLESIGSLNYGPVHAFHEEYRLVVDIPGDLIEYYSSTVPLKIQRPMHTAHITVMRKETPLNRAAWKKHHGTEVSFQYSPLIRNDATYWWIEVYCQRLEEIRAELGLPLMTDHTRPPDRSNCFHVTIGNTKGLP